MPLTPVDRYVLPLLDGTRDRAALVEALLGAARGGLICIERDGKRVSGEAELRDAAAEHVQAMPQRLAAMKLMRIGDHREPVARQRPGAVS